MPGIDVGFGGVLRKNWVQSWVPGLVLLLGGCASQIAPVSLADLEGAWWPEGASPTAEFAIVGDEIWLDFDAGYHPCRIVDGNTLVYDLGPELGVVERTIVSLEGDTLVLESTVAGEATRATYTRE